MKKIGIDVRLLGQTGVGRYITNLLFNLPYSSDIIYYVYVYNRGKNELPLRSKNVVIQEAPYHWHSIAEQTLFLGKLNEDNLSLMHFTYFSYPLLYRRKFIITLHDLIPYLYKTGKAAVGNQLIYFIKHFFYTLLIKNVVKNASAIITPSLTVKREITRLFGDQVRDKIQVIYEGVGEKLMNTLGNEKLKNYFSFPFFIYVGNFYPHKNVENLIQAFTFLHTDIKLVLLGPSDFFSSRILQLINRLKCHKKIILFQNPKDADLVFFYKNAQALIHPSFAEGFGLPLIEATYFHCPIIASDIPVFNEILDGQFVKFNPHDIKSIKNAIQQHITHPQKFSHHDILKRFSFKKMVDETMHLYQKLLNE